MSPFHENIVFKLKVYIIDKELFCPYNFRVLFITFIVYYEM
jgi:hypothetical protein